MVGDGDEKQKALQLVEELCIKDKIIFQPFRDDVPDVLASADIYVLPSLWEVTSNWFTGSHGDEQGSYRNKG